MIILFLSISSATNAWAGPLLNKHLPDFLQLDIQFRYRLEARDNLDFNDSLDDKDAFSLYRSRMNLAVVPNKHIKLFAQLQDARVSDSQFTNKAPYEDYMDLRQANLQLTDILSWANEDVPGVDLVIGRQEFSYGNQRLLGAFDWSNVSNQTFDSVKGSTNFKDAKVKLDVLGGVLVPNKSPREFNDFLDGTTKDRMYAYYLAWQGIDKVTVEQYLIQRKTNKGVSFGPSGSAELDEWTVGARLLGQGLNGFDYELESAWQGGKFDDKDIKAMMAVAVLGYTFSHSWSPRLALEYDYASGDSDASDGTRRTFDNLYPTNHMHYGYMDLVSLQNLNNVRIQGSVKPTKKLKLQTDYHLIYLDTYKDSLYSASRAVSRTASASNGSDLNTHVGNELDLTANYKYNDSLSVLIGYSHFFAGKYLAQTGANDDGDFAYVQTVLSF